MNTKFEIGSQVIRTKGDYGVGRIGNVIDIDTVKNKVQVLWTKEESVSGLVNIERGLFGMDTLKTWVKDDSIELTNIPYRIDTFTKKINSTATKYIRKYIKL